MRTIQLRSSHFEAMRELLSDPAAIADIHQDIQPGPAITEWLGRLELLQGVPFQNLVLASSMLPAESVRFFQIDKNWIYSLVEGALSIGTSTASEEAHATTMAGVLHAASRSACRQIRAARMPVQDPAQLRSGFLLRSVVVQGWPGLEVTAYDAQDVKLENVLRMDRLAPSVLLFVIEGLIDHVDIHEPPEGMHFGIDQDGTKALRYVTVPQGSPPEAHPGSQIEGVNAGAVPLRDYSRVVRINDLAGIIAAQLEKANANSGRFTSAEFALELVEGVQSVRFVNRKEGGP